MKYLVNYDWGWSDGNARKGIYVCAVGVNAHKAHTSGSAFLVDVM